MRNKKVSFRFLLLIIVLALAAFPSTSASANHSWNGFHWARTANPFTLKVGDNVSSAWDAYLDEAISDWNQSSVLQLAKVVGGTRPKNCRPTNGQIEACNARYGNTNWLGIAQIWISGSHITQAITKVNDTYFDTPTYNTPAWRRLVMCQEIAHDFGLAHQNEGFGPPNLGSCMDYTNDPDGGGAYGPTNEHPNAHDFDQLETIYSHLDNFNSYNSTNSMPPGFANADVHAVENWGEKIHESADGRSALYVRDFGDGYKVVTHVFWAE
jgi:hypothetical protein